MVRPLFASISFLALAVDALPPRRPTPLLTRQDDNNGPEWQGGFGPHGGYPGGSGYGTYPPGQWGHDNYHGWRPQPPPYGGGNGSGGAIIVPASTPSTASPPVDPNFIGFAFEEASFPRYVQNDDGSVNQFSLNLIDSIMSRTGGKPLIRLGGTSADYGRYIPSQTSPALPVAEVYNYQDVGGTSIGPSFWDLTSLVPDALYIVQLPMAHTNVSESVLWATTAAQHIGIDRILAFEPGNEADLYSNDYGGGLLGPPYYQGTLTNETYTGNFTKYVSAVKAAVDIPDQPFFQAFDTSMYLGDEVLANGYIFDVQTIFELGIDANNDVQSVAHHYYQTNGGEYADLSTGLMQHTAIADRLDLFRKFIVYLQENHPTIPFIISEVGNSLNPTHAYDYQATLGSALWSVDFQLYSMCIGIARINWQQIMHSGFDMWLPVDSGNSSRTVFSNFYPMPFIGDFIGAGGTTQATELDTGVNNVVAYAAYVGDKLQRIAVVNLNAWDFNNTIARPSSNLTFQVASGFSKVLVDVLGSPQGAHASGDNITYAGSQWTSASNGLEVKNVVQDSQTLKVDADGQFKVEVYDSEALLLHLS